MSSGRKFKRGFLDGFYEIFQKDPFIVKMSGVTQENEDKNEDANAKKTLDKRTLSVFVARKIRDNYMDICASLPWERIEEPAIFFFQYLKESQTSAFFDRRPERSLLSEVFDSISVEDTFVSPQVLFDTIVEHTQDAETPGGLSLKPLENREDLQGFIRALSELRAESTPYEKDAVDGRGDKYALLTEIKKILKRISKETQTAAQKDFSVERLILARTLKLCFDSEGYGKAWWQRWFEILCFYMDEQALKIATTEAFLDLVIVKLFEQKQIEAKYRNRNDGRDLSQKPQTKNIFAQDITFKDIRETYYINRLIVSMDEKKEEKKRGEKNLLTAGDPKQNFEMMLRYHAAYISTASTSRFPAETGRLFSGTTSATGKNTQCTKQLLSIFSYLYFYELCRFEKTNPKAMADFRKFNLAARITVDEKSVFNDRDIFRDGFDTAQGNYLMAIYDCINAVQRDFLYIFEKTQRVVNAPTRMQGDDETPRDQKIARYMKSIMNKLTALHKGEVSRDGDVSLLKKDAERIVFLCEEYSLHIPDSLIENAMQAALAYEKKKEQEKVNSDTEAIKGEKEEEVLEDAENMAQYFMNECLKSLEEKFNDAAEKDFLCNQLLLRQDFATVRRLLFRFVRYNDFTNECILDIDLLEMRNELLENIDDVQIYLDEKSEKTDNGYGLKVADMIFAKSLSQNIVEANGTDDYSEMIRLIAEKARIPVLEKNSDNNYRFVCDLDRLILAGIGFARKYDGSETIKAHFEDIFRVHFIERHNNHLDYYFDPFILFGTIVISSLSDKTREKLIYDLCKGVRTSRLAKDRALQEGYILLLNNVLLQTHICLSYHERKKIFDYIFSTNMYPKQWQAYERLKKRSFYSDYAKQEYRSFLESAAQSPRFIYLAAAEAPAIPDEKINQGDFKFDLGLTARTVEDYHQYCLRFQYLSWTQSKHTIQAECVQSIVNLGKELSVNILAQTDTDKKKFALATQMLLMGVSNLIRSDRLQSADSGKIPYHVFHKEMVDIMILSEYLQRSMNRDYQNYLAQDFSESEAPIPDFWMVCGGLRYVAAIWKDPEKIPSYRVHLFDDEAKIFAKSLNTTASACFRRFYGMDHRWIYSFTDYFDTRSEEKQETLNRLLDGKEEMYLAYDNMEIYQAQMKEEIQA